MKVLLLLVLIWAPVAYVVWKARRGWRSWSDFVKVFLVGTLMGAALFMDGGDPMRAAALALSIGIAAAAGLWAFGDGTLPSTRASSATWDLFPDSRERWQRGKLVCLATLWVSLASVIAWTLQWFSIELRVAFTTASAVLAVTSVLIWYLTVRSAQQSSS